MKKGRVEQKEIYQKRDKEMKEMLFIVTTCFLTSFIGTAQADETEIMKELQQLKERVAELEAKLKEKVAKPPSSLPGEIRTNESDLSSVKKAEGELVEEKKQEKKEEPESKATELIIEKLGTLSLHGCMLSYYQGASKSAIGGIHFENPDGAGYAGDLELTFEPVKNGEFFLRLHAGEGDGADKHLEETGALFADLNTINDDNPGDNDFDLLDVFYMQGFFDNRFFFSIGKTEPLSFMDDNEFANNEVSQFVGKPFVNDPVIDSEDEYAPLLAVSFLPSDRFSLVALVQSSSYPLLEEDRQKDKYDDIFEQPFFAGQLTYSPVIKKLQGNYRLYGWVQTYDHPTLRGDDTEEGWGVGISCDQQIQKKVGVFGRFGYHNEDVYEVPWFWSVGTNIRGLIPIRSDAEIGCGVAGLKANDDLQNDDTEYHLEAYYKAVLSEYLALTLDFQCVSNPLGDSSNDDVFAGMVRGEFSF